MKPLHCAIYARISMIDEKAGTNVEKTADQIVNLERYAKQKEYEVVAVYEDDGISAKTAGIRPQFDQMMTDLGKKKFEIILATEDARLARNDFEKAALTVTAAAAGVCWDTIRDGFTNPSTASGAFMSTVRGAMDAFEVARKAERQIQGNADTREKGRPFRSGARPFGFEEDRMTLRPAEADLIRDGIRMILAGASLHRVVETWRASGVQPRRAKAWTRASVRSTLVRWSNAAVVEHDGEPICEGVDEWERIVPRHMLEQVRGMLLNSRSPMAKQYAKNLLTGIGTCHCGAALMSNGLPRPTKGRRSNYVCSARVRGLHRPGLEHVGIAVELLDPLVTQRMIDIYLTSPDSSGAVTSEAMELAEWHEEYRRANSATKRLHDHYFGDDNTLSPNEFKHRDAQNKAREQRALDAIEQLVSASAHAAMLVKSQELLRALTLEFQEAHPHVASYFETRTGARSDVEAAWQQLPFDDKRALIAANLTITVSPGRGTDRVAIKRKASTEGTAA